MIYLTRSEALSFSRLMPCVRMGRVPGPRQIRTQLGSGGLFLLDDRLRVREARSLTSAAEKFTLKSQEALELAQNTAANRGNPQVESEHLLLALLSDEEGICVEILKKLGADSDRIRNEALHAVERLPQQSGATAER